MSWRRLSEPDDWTAIAPMIHAIPRPTQAVSTAPSIPSTVRSPGNRNSERACTASPSNPLASTPPASSAPSNPNSGPYCE